jgi:hypothetical protein
MPAEQQPDDPADGEDPPFPAFLLLLGGFGQGHGSQSPHRCHGKGQFFHVRGDAVEGVSQPELVDALNDLGPDQQQDGIIQSRWKKVRSTRDSDWGRGATQVGMYSVRPSILAASDCTRYWFHSNPWNGEARAAPAM